MIGKDPILLARDLDARGADGQTEYHGFHLNLGILKEPTAALTALQTYLEFLAVHRNSANIERDVKAQLHRAGLQGAVEVLRIGAGELVG